MMDRRVADQCIHLMKNSTTITTVDLTGGAPELNSQFKSAPLSANASYIWMTSWQISGGECTKPGV